MAFSIAFPVLLLIFYWKMGLLARLAIIHYSVTVVPLAVVLSLSAEKSALANHSAINSILISLALLFSIIILKLFPKAQKKISPEVFRYRNYIICFAIILFLEFVLFIYGKPLSVLSLLKGTLVEDRLSIINYPGFIKYFSGNLYAIELLLLVVGFVYIKKIPEKRLISYILLLITLIFYFGQLRKSVALVAFLAIFLISLRLYGSRYLSFTKNIYISVRKNLFSYGILAVVFFAVAASYYSHTESIVNSLLGRIFLESVQYTDAFYQKYGPFTCCNLAYVYSDGAGIFGFSGINLENQLFFDLFQNRSERYGNSPVLSLVSGQAAFGKYIYAYAFIAYSFIFILSGYLANKEKASLKFGIVNVMLAIEFMTIFSTGLLRTFSIFIGFSLSTWLLIFSIIFTLFSRFGSSKKAKKDFRYRSNIVHT